MGRVGVPEAEETFGLCMQVVRLTALRKRGCGMYLKASEVLFYVLCMRTKTLLGNECFLPKVDERDVFST
jgi:hypothetical protein